MAQPAVDVSTVAVFPDRVPCRVYGRISAHDKLDQLPQHHTLYVRNAQHPELISEIGQALSVSDLDKVLLMQQPVISLHLLIKDMEDENDGALFADKEVKLDCNMSNDYEEVKQSYVEGSRGLVVVNYIAMSCPLVADIYEIRLDQSFSSLYGSIIAQYGKTFGETSNFRIPLLNVPSTESVPIVCGEDASPCIKLSRKLVAVPAYSNLMIKANLLKPISSSEAAVIVDGGHNPGELWPAHWSSFSYFQHDKCKGWPLAYNNAFTLFVRWFTLLYLRPSPKPFLTNLSSLVLDGDVMLEVFSVFIGRENDVDLNVSGKISLRYEEGFGEVVIFNRDESNLDKLLNGRKKLDITFPSGAIKADTIITFFTMLVNLKDADRGFLIEDGVIHFDTMRRRAYENLFDRPTRTVIPGENGYCAVHYAVYKSAEMVNTKITLLYKGSLAVGQVGVHGKIVAWVDIVDNRTDYDQRIIYDKPPGTKYTPHTIKASKRNSDQQHSSLAQVELSESSLVVPFDLIFKIGVEVYASSDRGTSISIPERLVCDFELRDQDEQVISGKEFDLKFRFYYE